MKVKSFVYLFWMYSTLCLKDIFSPNANFVPVLRDRLCSSCVWGGWHACL
jgi:hypothetical protein